MSQKPHSQTSQNFLYMLSVAMGQSSSDDSATYVLPILWMTSYFHIMGHIVSGIGTNDVGAAKSQNFELTCQRVPCCLTLLS